MRHHDHAGVGTLSLQNAQGQLASWRFTLAHNVEAMRLQELFQRQIEVLAHGAPLQQRGQARCPQCKLVLEQAGDACPVCHREQHAARRSVGGCISFRIHGKFVHLPTRVSAADARVDAKAANADGDTERREYLNPRPELAPFDRSSEPVVRRITPALVDRLTPKQAAVIRARYGLGMSLLQTSAATGVTENGVKKLQQRGLFRLRQMLEGEAA